MRVRPLAGVAGAVVFTAAWVAGSLRQTGHGVLSVQLSGLAADDARDPWIMITGFVVLGACTVLFGQELAAELHGGLGPRLIQLAGVLAIAVGLLRRDHVELTTGADSWHNQAHNIVSLVLYGDLVLAQLLLARRFGAVPAWRAWRPYLAASGIATGVALAVFVPNITSPSGGVLQRVAVSIPLLAVTAMAVQLARCPAARTSQAPLASSVSQQPRNGPIQVRVRHRRLLQCRCSRSAGTRRARRCSRWPRRSHGSSR